jgi:hypothetical protein
MRRVRFAGAAAAALLVAAVGCTKEVTMESVGPTVVQSPASVASVAIQGGTSIYGRGQTTQLTAVATMSNGFTEDRTSSATWSSDNSNVASVSSSGVVTGGDEGDATISATVDGQRGSARVQVRHAYRAPDPPAGQRLPMPNPLPYVQEVRNQYPDAFRNSCQDQGGTWEFMDRLVDRLRLVDLRYAYNGRRGDPNFVGRDEVAYHYGAGPSENSRDVYVWDVIAGHCGSNPQPANLDMTEFGGIWLTRGRF